MMLTYNHDQFINEAIRSVVLQKFDKPFELIIGDDCSTDNTLSICKEWQKRYPHIIKILERPYNIGVQRNLLETLNVCTGKYLAKCEGDDYWCSKHKLRRQVEYLEQHPNCNVCFHRVINYYSHNNTKSLSNGKQKTDTTINDLAKSNYITNLSVMYRRSALPILPEWLSEVPAPDYTLHMLHATSGYIHFINKPMAVYRKHSQGVWGVAAHEKQLKMALNSRIKLIEYFQDNVPVKNELIETFTSIALSLITLYQNNNDTSNALNVKNLILKYHTDWEEEDFQAKLEQYNSKLIKSQKNKIIIFLQKLRGFVSRILPLPKIRQNKY